jgi:hypothetical protein
MVGVRAAYRCSHKVVSVQRGVIPTSGILEDVAGSQTC